LLRFEHSGLYLHKTYVSEGRDVAVREKDNYAKKLNKLPNEKRIEVEMLEKKMADKKLSNEERNAIMNKITDIFAQYA